MKELVLPPRLQPGDTVAVIAPASPPRTRSAVRRGLQYLRGRGFQVLAGESVGSEFGYLAGQDSVRLKDLHRMFYDPGVRAIICLRGGYGSARLLDDIDYARIRKNPKILVGFSDVTALSLALLSRAGLLTFAGPMAAVEMASGIPASTERMMWKMLMKTPTLQAIDFNPDARVFSRGTAEGRLIGGNMAVFTSLLGTKYFPDTHGAILFLEDVGENIYKIDRMLTQLRQAGVLGTLGGVALGSFTAIPADARTRQLEEVFEEHLTPLQIPVVSGLPFGHIAEKATLPIGAKVRLDAGRKRLTVLQKVLA